MIIPMIIAQQLVKNMLKHPKRHEWSLQGLGMLRTYLDPERRLRLHIWTEAGANEGVSELHTHPWDFTSIVIAGQIHNTRYTTPPASDAPYCSDWQEQMIKCGVGGGLVGEPTIVTLQEHKTERYPQGATYRQKAEEIHRSNPADGTVSIILRTFGTDTEHAHVYFPVDQEWVTAEPRPATADEIKTICDNALARWF